MDTWFYHILYNGCCYFMLGLQYIHVSKPGIGLKILPFTLIYNRRWYLFCASFGWMVLIGKRVLLSKRCFKIYKYNCCLIITHRYHARHNIHNVLMWPINYIHSLIIWNVSCAYRRSMLLVDLVIKAAMISSMILKWIAGVLSFEWLLHWCQMYLQCLKEKQMSTCN